MERSLSENLPNTKTSKERKSPATPLAPVHRRRACFYRTGFHDYLVAEMYKHGQHTVRLWKDLDQYKEQKNEEKRKGKILSSLFTLKLP